MKFGTGWYDFFLGTERCQLCGVGGSAPLCEDCLGRLPLLFDFPPERRCAICGAPLPVEDDRCLDCRSRPAPHFDGNRPLALYTDLMKALLHRYKQQNCTELAWWFADLLAPTVSDLNRPLAPVPPRRHKIHRRGWDQVDLICRILAKRYGVEILRPLRRRDDVEQKSLGRDERLNHLRDQLTLRRSVRVPEEVTLFDDVFTTGATLDACATALKEAGAQRVTAVTLVIVL